MNKLTRKTSRALAAVATLLASAAAHAAPTAQEMVAAADRIRNPGKAFQLANTLTEYVKGSVSNKSTVVVYAKSNDSTGQYQNIVRYVAPARDVGKLLLLSGTTLWFYDSAARTSVRIAPQQRLIGQASNGDVLTANLSRDYKAKLVGETTIANSAGAKIACWELDLARASSDAFYSRMTYWLESGSYRPVKAKYYSDSGRVLKIAYFGDYKMLLGAMRPSETIIIDGVNSSLVTTIRTSSMQTRAIPDIWFQRDYLPRVPLK